MGRDGRLPRTRREWEVGKHHQYMVNRCWERQQKNGTITTRGMRLKEGKFSNGIYDHSDPMVIFTDPISYSKRLVYNPVFES